ncbi:alpha/beta fold hydrolase, partial [Pseudomonas corrugata]
ERIVLVHGYAANKDNWLGLASRLKGQGYRLLIPDLPGFGQSSLASDGEYGVAIQAERLRSFTQALQLDRFHLIGHSMGGYVAGAYTSLYPDQLLSTYLVAPAGVNGGVPSLLRRKGEIEGRNPLFVDSVESFHSTMAIAMVKPPQVPLRLIEVIVARERPLRALRQTQTAFWFSDPLENMLRGCEVPLRLLWGELDQVLPVEGADQLLAAVTSASLKRLSGVGHMPLVEAPEELTRDYLDFIRTYGRKLR